jgi:CO dehydrogenase maturation factor
MLWYATFRNDTSYHYNLIDCGERMKVAFVGKGGSGKTTLSALFCRYLASLPVPVVAFDADINQHLGEALGLSETDAAEIPALGLEMDRIKDYLRGSNPRIPSAAAMAKTTPPGRGSRLWSVREDNAIFSYFARDVNGVKLLVTGPFSEDDLGLKCYHSKTKVRPPKASSTERFYHEPLKN